MLNIFYILYEKIEFFWQDGGRTTPPLPDMGHVPPPQKKSRFLRPPLVLGINIRYNNLRKNIVNCTCVHILSNPVRLLLVVNLQNL